VFCISGCNFVPKEKFHVSSFIDMKFRGLKLDTYSFTSVGDILNKDEYLGNTFQGSYSSEYGNVFFFAANTKSNKPAYDLWLSFAQSDGQGLQRFFKAIPFYYGSYKDNSINKNVLCWFREKWFFRIETENKDVLEYFYNAVEIFMGGDGINNESVAEI